jgi:hypothetical protein
MKRHGENYKWRTDYLRAQGFKVKQAHVCKICQAVSPSKATCENHWSAGKNRTKRVVVCNFRLQHKDTDLLHGSVGSASPGRL